jgi:hypothetical protein
MLALLPTPLGASDYQEHSYAPEGSFAGRVGGAMIDLQNITPGRVFQWATVGFAVALMGLVILAIVLAMFGVYG